MHLNYEEVKRTKTKNKNFRAVIEDKGTHVQLIVDGKVKTYPTMEEALFFLKRFHELNTN